MQRLQLDISLGEETTQCSHTGWAGAPPVVPVVLAASDVCCFAKHQRFGATEDTVPALQADEYAAIKGCLSARDAGQPACSGFQQFGTAKRLPPAKHGATQLTRSRSKRNQLLQQVGVAGVQGDCQADNTLWTCLAAQTVDLLVKATA
ncbi:hypothetical protein ABBQ38_004584 [Trebouxia sp. C0009 RCD-2024]